MARIGDGGDLGGHQRKLGREGVDEGDELCPQGRVTVYSYDTCG